MADIVDQKTRSRMMSGISGKDTKPELLLRKAMYAWGYRYRLHYNKLSGRPDIVMPGRRIAIFVHGCFWHRHEGCRCATIPATRPEFWARKFERNVERDAENIAALVESGWRVAVVWECGLKSATFDENLGLLLEWIEKPEADATCLTIPRTE